MVKTGIKIFARLRPTKKGTAVYEVSEREDGLSSLSFTVPRSEGGGIVDNRRETFSFRFSRVFDGKAGQEEVFSEVSRGVIDNCLEGYNGTIFAYGQTGSGKTFTITGGVERYGDRGLIPRSLSYLFQQYSKTPDTLFTTHISYLEIYNESGYDLLDPRHEAARLEDLPKVTLLEDKDSVIHLRNLSLHPANNEEEALNWLFLGDTNRVMAETPMNMASTRSHCIFTIHISSRQPGSDVIRRAKLHLVDLAGSERVGRTGVEGIQLAEAKYINLSLHYLEQVIVALSDKSRSHIPYRNSMMTSVLRDSLGGNCMTSMIATCSIERRNIDETVSTCRFSQRVALVKNEAILNEELDPKLMVQHLKQKVCELEEELSLVTGGQEREGELEETERGRCEQLVKVFMEDPSPEARLLAGRDMRKIQLCFFLLKARAQTTPSTGPACGGAAMETNSDPMTSELRRLEELIHQRDEEISMLVERLGQEKQKVSELTGSSVVAGQREEEGGEGERREREGGKKEEKERENSAVQLEGEGGASQLEGEGGASGKAWRSELTRARQEAFDGFRKDCPLMAQVNQHKEDLRTRYAEAKSVGEQVNISRSTINQLKAQIERHRISRGLEAITRGVVKDKGPDEREEEMKAEIETEKTRFKSLYQTLRGMKTEIEHVQHLLDTAKVKVQQEFEVWWQGQVVKSGGQRSAWQTPPTSTPSPQAHGHYTPYPLGQMTSHSGHNTGHSGHNTDHSGHNTGHSGHTTSHSGHNTDHSGHNTGHSGHTTNHSGHHATSSPLEGRSTVKDYSGHHPHPGRDSGHHPHPGRHPKDSGHHSHPGHDSGHGTTVPLAYRTPVKPQPLMTPTSPPTPQSSNFPPPPKDPPPHSIPLTGDPKADADILAFYRARQHLVNRGN